MARHYIVDNSAAVRRALVKAKDHSMAETTTGQFKVSQDVNTNLVQGTFVCSCGASQAGLATVQKGSTRTFNCTRCKKKVTIVVPK
jgi:hypothetical protein